jgi:tetratricopeptide (TPR) repeat protein
MLETAPATPHTEYHLGVAQWHAGDRAQAVRSWERSLRRASSRWPSLRCLAVADQASGHHERAAARYADAFDDLCRALPHGPKDTAHTPGDGAGAGDDGEIWAAARAALGRETLRALLRVRRTAEARAVWDRLPPAVRERGRFRLLEAELLLAEGRPEAARAVLDEDVEVADLREGEETIGRLWSRLTDEPLPARLDFRMRPDQP